MKRILVTGATGRTGRLVFKKLRDESDKKDDELLNNPPNGIPTSIPRADVASIVVNALNEPTARNKTFDVISKPEDATDAQVTTDFTSLFEQTTAGI